jgi:starch phosphorylase
MRIPASLLHEVRTADDGRVGSTIEAIRRGFVDNLFYTLGRFPEVATRNDAYLALALTVRDRLLGQWVDTLQTYYERKSRTVCMLSAEFLLGPQLESNLVQLGLLEQARAAMASFGLDLEQLIEHEEEPGLGNGGLGRLSACLLDSLATHQLPAIGYGIRYEFGIFDQAIRDGWQVEIADKWLASGYPWEIARPEIAYEIGFGGRTQRYVDERGHERTLWLPTRRVRGVAYDTPIAGYRVRTTNLLRLWKAEACESFDLQAFQVGDYYRAVGEKVVSETITKILYPNEEPAQGKRLRLEQQYFFVSCSLRDLLRLHLQTCPDVSGFDARYAIQLNDTHPSLAVVELLRILLDEHGLGWDEAWAMTSRSFGYTNHTLMPEALERWPVTLMGELLPRHLELVREIDRRLALEVRARTSGDEARVRRMAIVETESEPAVRMAHLAVVGSRVVNGVSRLHSQMVRRQLLPDFAELWPEKFASVTNGVTPRRFLLVTNPRLSRLLTDSLGSDRWATHLDELRALEPRSNDRAFRSALGAIKAENKRELAQFLARTQRASVDPEGLFVVLAKRVHEYKRQHLLAIALLARLVRLVSGLDADAPPRTVIFAGKAAPSYAMAKLVIKLVHAVGAAIDAEPRARGRLRVVFVPDYNVKLAERLVPAAEVSAQLSCLGTEASGTGNMKLAMNGALTLGTLDGANLELFEAVGPEGFFRFGREVQDGSLITPTSVRAARAKDAGLGADVARAMPDELSAALEWIGSGRLSSGDRELFAPLLAELRTRDRYEVLSDYASLAQADRAIDAAYLDRDDWNRRSALVVCRSGRFSSDRATLEYARDVWKVERVPITADERAALRASEQTCGPRLDPRQAAR